MTANPAKPSPRSIAQLRTHVRYVAQQSCLICGHRPADTHHLRFAQNRALSRKASDEFTVSGATIARSITLATKEAGGRRPEMIRPSPLVPYGWKLLTPGNCRSGRCLRSRQQERSEKDQA
jgi:hypothetical protein